MLEISCNYFTEILAFRDYLRSNPDASAKYGTLKRCLASRPLPDCAD